MLRNNRNPPLNYLNGCQYREGQCCYAPYHENKESLVVGLSIVNLIHVTMQQLIKYTKREGQLKSISFNALKEAVSSYEKICFLS